MPLWKNQSNRSYHNGVQYFDLLEYSGSSTTNSSGNAVFYLTDDGTAAGKAIFSNVIAESLTLTPISTSTIYLNSGATISADLKTMTISVRQNTSLLGLGLIPFSTAQAGAVVYARVKGVAA